MELTPSRAIVSVGYMIYPVNANRAVDAGTRSRVSNSSPAAAASWAAKLKDDFAKYALCGASADDIANGLLKAVKEMDKCTNTADPTCSVLQELIRC